MDLDTNLYFILESLARTLNVTKTARELAMSQSAVSHALARLRDHFEDPLFVRVPKGVQPTELARSMRDDVERFVQMAKKLSKKAEPFDLQKVEARITILTTDLVEVLLMPRILPRLKKEAPGLSLSIRPTGGELPRDELQSGRFDLAIAGFYKDVPEGFYQTKLADLDFSTAYRKDHPKARTGLTLAEFYECEHALITLQGDFKDNFEKASGSKKRRFRYGSYSFTGMAWTLANSDLVLTAPTALLHEYKRFFPIKIQKPPVETPKINLRMVWHQQTHKDPLRMWLRQLIKEEIARL